MPTASSLDSNDDLPDFAEETLLTQLGGDRSLAAVIIRSAMSDIPKYFDRLESSLAACNWNEAQRVAHTTKGLLVQIGGMKLASGMKELSDLLKRGGHPDGATVAELRNGYRTLSKMLTE